MAYSPGGTTPVNPEDDQARLAKLEAMQRALTWSGSDPNATNSSATGATTYDMDALRAQAGALGRAADAANAARSGDVGISGMTFQQTGSQYMPGSEPTPYSPPAIPSQSIPQQITSIPTGSLSTPPTGGQSNISSPTTSGSITPPTRTTPTTTTGGGVPLPPGWGGNTTTTTPTGAGAGTGIGTGTGTGTGAGPTGAGSGIIDQSGAGAGGSLGALTGSIVGQLQSISQGLTNPGTPADVTGVFLKQSQDILAMLDDQEKQLRADAQQQGTTIDPATAFALDKLRENLEGNLKTTREDLNRRGLSDSGILLQLENNLQKGNASDQAQILATRLSKLQDQLSAGLTSIRTQKYNTVSQFGLDAARAQTTSNENARRLAADREQAALQGMLNLRGQMNTAETARLGQEAETGRATASNLSAMQRAALNEQGANARNTASIAGENTRAESGNAAAMQRALLAEQGATARAGADRGMTEYQRAQLELERQRLAQNQTKNSATNTDAALASVLRNYTDPVAARNAIQTNAAALQRAGVDINGLLDQADAALNPAGTPVYGRARTGRPD